jgi:hypothetical protein
MAAGFLEQFKILRFLPRVCAEIFVRRELGGIDENARHGLADKAIRATDQRKVALVQGAHGWDKSHRLPGGPPCVYPCPQRL